MSPAEMVFAIPELLEQVLLNLDCRTLFAVQRVSKVFHKTISSSIHLRRRMNLDYKTSVNGGPHYESLIADLTHNGQLNLAPFKFDREVIYPQPSRVLVIVFKLMLLRGLAQSNAPVGMVKHGNIIGDEPLASWRRMCLTHRSVGVVLELHVKAALLFQYNECVFFAAGQGSLGEVVSVIERVRKRTFEQHERRAKELVHG